MKNRKPDTYRAKRQGGGRRAFTLIETFVAVTVIMTALVGPLTISQRSLALSSFSRDKMTAYYLAQDAVEYIRGLRDDNAKQGKSWDALIALLGRCQASSSPAGCRINSVLISDDAAITPCGESCAPMSYNVATGLYTTDDPASGIIPSIFTRNIIVSAPPYNTSPNHELFITVNVKWQNEGVPQTYTVVQDLFDW